MDDLRVGGAFRAVRLRRGWRQRDVAGSAGISQQLVSLIERGHLSDLSLNALRGVASTLDIRIDVIARWRGGDLDRLVNRHHSALHELVARWFRTLPAWTIAPEVSFAVYGERGVIDILAWHAASRSLLVIELKTELADVQETVGTLDRKRRLAARVAHERGWDPLSVSSWLIVAGSRTNRRHIATHAAMLRAAYPADLRGIGRWLRSPGEPIAAMSTWPDTSRSSAGPQTTSSKRVPAPRGGVAKRGSTSNLVAGERQRADSDV